MAVTKKLVINSRLDSRVNYALNEEKTKGLVQSIEYAVNRTKTESEKTIYETAINCTLKNAYSEMIETKIAKKNKDRRLGYHIIQSFKPGETTPEIAHKIGCEFAKNSFGARFEVVVATHLDKAHLHNHIIINSVSFLDGRKYRDSQTDFYEGIKKASDDVCRKYGLSVIESPIEKKALTYFEWQARQNEKTSWQSIIRTDIDDCVKQSFSYGNFLVLMEHKGYEIKQGKYIAFRPFGKERFSRGYKLGHEYSQENIRNRVEGKDLKVGLSEVRTYTKTKQNNLYPKGKVVGIKALYARYLYLMGMIKKNKLPDRAAFVLKEDLLRFERITKTYQFVTDRNLDTVEQVEDYKEKCYQTIDLLKEDQLKSKAVSGKREKLYKALTVIRTLEKAHQLYLDGYTGMIKEHKEYMNSFRFLTQEGYGTPQRLNELEKEKSDVTENIARNANHIRHFRYEIRMCNNALAENKEIENKLQKIDEQRENKQQRREKQHDTGKR